MHTIEYTQTLQTFLRVDEVVVDEQTKYADYTTDVGVSTVVSPPSGSIINTPSTRWVRGITSTTFAAPLTMGVDMEGKPQYYGTLTT